jgi:hypothetical protein
MGSGMTHPSYQKRPLSSTDSAAFPAIFGKMSFVNEKTLTFLSAAV